MLKDFLYLFFVCFFISLMATIYQNKKLINKDEAKPKWIKFWVYIVIIVLISIIFYYDNNYLKIILLLILGLRSIYELWLIRNLLTSKNVIITAIPIIIISSLKLLYLEKNIAFSIYAIIFIFDGFSQIGGQLIKSPKIAPTISNGKTLAGLVIGCGISFIAYFQLFVKNNVHLEFIFNLLCFFIHHYWMFFWRSWCFIYKTKS